jgi:hypothetical protein
MARHDSRVCGLLAPGGNPSGSGLIALPIFRIAGRVQYRAKLHFMLVDAGRLHALLRNVSPYCEADRKEVDYNLAIIPLGQAGDPRQGTIGASQDFGPTGNGHSENSAPRMGPLPAWKLSRSNSITPDLREPSSRLKFIESCRSKPGTAPKAASV